MTCEQVLMQILQAQQVHRHNRRCIPDGRRPTTLRAALECGDQRWAVTRGGRQRVRAEGAVGCWRQQRCVFFQRGYPRATT